MIELMKKTMFAGIGFAALTKEKVEELAAEFRSQGKLSEQEGEKLVDEIMQRSREAQQEMSQKIEGLVKEGLERMNLARMSDVEELQDEMARLRERLQKLESQQKSD